MSGTFNVADLSPFNVGDELDSRMNHAKEGGNDIDVKLKDGELDGENDKKTKDTAKDPLSMPQGLRNFKRP